MRKLIVRLNTGYSGEEMHEAFTVPYDFTDDEIDRECWDMAVQHAEMFGHYLDEEDDDGDYYETDQIDYEWWDYRGEEDDDYRCGGGSFEEDFE